MNNTPQQLHVPVLLSAVLDVLRPQPGENYLDLTAGFGGHATAVIAATGRPDRAVLVDRDQTAINALQPLAKAGARVIHGDYASIAWSLAQDGERFDMILIDLGVSSPQLDTEGRGFSFRFDAPLDMRMDQSQGQTAAELLNTASRTALIDLLRTYGEEPKAVQIADSIVRHRPITTTSQLAQLVEQVYRGRKGKIHPATQTFQALRIGVNDELRQLDQTLPYLLDLLAPGGRVAIISFHSLEDRLVKQFMLEQARSGYEAELQLLTKHPIKGATEDVNNPRARSAKLRAAVKIKQKGRSHA